ncbi:helix-turn-helix domain-containing protein [Nocardioides hwasunensis]|uniref:Helix-turn-helix transcriptional regulator n=1 Tax=Nocardioides hwasunensis TaxID=397258 RepID=A0ABR8MAF8_9ACTN|nr:helix-turn-helix transcriptional regulator [Nocardioides hwasunensis]MBD3913151.1 helix-turn-helix transcriptional regulator [Nocardioides hwasunensis]
MDTRTGTQGGAQKDELTERLRERFDDKRARRESRVRWLESRSEWTDDEWAWFCLGPFGGEIPGMVRRVRRILDVSQRGLAALLGVSQSVVARWETGRTSPRSSVMERLFEMAGLGALVVDEKTGEQVEPMRNDGVRTRSGSRFPAHTDPRVNGWRVPPGVVSTMAAYYAWQDTSRARRDPMVRARISPHLRRIERYVRGTPVDHPSLTQCVAEAQHQDDLRASRRAGRLAA